MPCDTIRSTDLDAGKMAPPYISAALEALGLRPKHNDAGVYSFTGGSYNFRTGTLTLQGGNVDQRTSQIKQAYSAEIVKAQAKKFGWTLKETGKFQYAITKR